MTGTKDIMNGNVKYTTIKIFLIDYWQKSREGNGEEACTGVIPYSKEFWYDSDSPQYNYEWYATGTYCQQYGYHFANFGHKACCTCKQNGSVIITRKDGKIGIIVTAHG